MRDLGVGREHISPPRRMQARRPALVVRDPVEHPPKAVAALSLLSLFGSSTSAMGASLRGSCDGW
eukprot:4983177-Prymnesium_polylepis.1